MGKRETFYLSFRDLILTYISTVDNMLLFPNTLILLKGAGDLGTGVAWRLHKAGFPVIITELAQPLVVRRTVALASAVYDGEIAVEGVTAWRAESFDAARGLLN